MTTKQQGYRLIADITGYTMYLSKSELEHAHKVLQLLLELLIEHTRPPLVISRLAGDAVISYGLQDNFLSGQTFVEMIEDTYVAFRKLIDRMVLNTTCTCNACANITSLDLKFFVHYGSFTLQKLDSHSELLGADVIVIHRLLKNRVTERTGFRAYTLYTDAAVHRLGIESIAESMTPHSEKYEHIGEVDVWLKDMHPVWQAKKDAARITIAPEDVSICREIDLPLTLTQAWEVITDPEYRAILLNSESQEIENRQDGRLAPGSVYRCYHGDGRITVQTILEWVPFEQLTTEDTTPVPNTTVLVNLCLLPGETCTKLVVTCGKARGPLLNRLVSDLMGRVLLPRHIKLGSEKLRQRLEVDLATGLFDQPEHVRPPDDHVHAEVEAELVGSAGAGE